ncbi:hypothetical protein JCM11641_000843 [Rhodosporidiobolus odoratus]
MESQAEYSAIELTITSSAVTRHTVASSTPAEDHAASVVSGIPASLESFPLSWDDQGQSVCRICFGSDVDDEELGKLIVPCKCSGTARFVHQECLTSWRLADKKNGFYQCTMCGYQYHLRDTFWTRAAKSKAFIPLLTILFSLIIANLVSLAGPPLMRLAERRVYSSDQVPPFEWKRALREYTLGDLVVTGDCVRETTSLVGFYLGDCEWSAFHEPMWTDITSDKLREEGTTLSMVQSASLTKCGEKWGMEEDRASERWTVRALVRLVSGSTLLGIGSALFAQQTLRYYLLVQAIYFIHRPLADLLRVRRIETVGLMSMNAILTGLAMTRPGMKQARSQGRLFTFSQIMALMASAFSA